jgi:type I restriction enzyme, R subunit
LAGRIQDKKDFFDQFGPEARAIINELLNKYAEHGMAQFSLPDVFEVPPISQHGNLKEIAAKFGGTDKLVEAFGKLQTLLYAA